MRAGGEEMLDEVLGFALHDGVLAGAHADDALAPSALGAVRTDVGALNEAVVREGDDDALIGDEVLDRHVALVGDDIGAARRGVLVFNFCQAFFDDAQHAIFAGDDVHQILDPDEQLVVLTFDFILLEAGQLVQAQLENGIHLNLAEQIKTALDSLFVADLDAPFLEHFFRKLERQQLDPGLVAVVRVSDDADELVEVGQRAEVALERLGAGLGLGQLEARAAQDDFAAMLNVGIDHLLDVHRLGPAVVDRQRVDAERRGQLRELVQLVDDHLGHGVALELDDNARVFVRLVAHGGDVGDRFFIGQRRDFLDQRGAVDHVRNLRDDNLLAVALHLLDADAAALLDAAPAGLEIVADRVQPNGETAGREVRPLDEFHQPLDADVRVVDLRADTIDDFSEVVRRDARGHADRDAGAAVDEQVRERCREHGRLLTGLVVVGHPIDGVLVHVDHQRVAKVREARLGVTHGGRRVALDGAEVPLPVHERASHRPRLRHVDERRVNRRLAVRVIVAACVAADLGALAVMPAGREVQVVHREQDAALRRLEPVTRIRQRARNNHRHRVVEERVFDFIRDVDGLNLLAGGEQRRVACG